MAYFGKAENIKVGTIGYGGAFRMGKFHLDLCAKAGMCPTAVAEIDPARLEEAKKDFPGIETYSSASDMLKKSGVNLVIVITPHNSHARLAIQSLKAGKHVVVEKPMAITTAECDAMIKAASSRKLLLSAFHNRHWDGCIMEAVKRIKSGVIGEVFRIEAHMGSYSQPKDWWRSSRSISGGILYDWGVHLLEYSLQIIDSEIKEVSGFAKTGYWAKHTRWAKDTIEDEGFAVVRFASGAWLTLTITNLDANPKKGQLEITGTKGTYIMSGAEYEIITRQANETRVIRGQNPPSEPWRYYENIANHLVKGEKLVITPEWARRPVHILDLASQSAKRKRALKAKYP
ncbi:MAG: Gfo/Idh/MocA family oxidoreductase [Candidatus Omnitrophica bacterium]|nr:Gfo/Idh/MocA family oxidoreductase [Candidatus Omnitrophota bacterium]